MTVGTEDVFDSSCSRTVREELLREGFASFEAFCGLLQVQPKDGGGRIPLALTPLQRAYCAARTSRDIVLKARQVYFTTLEAARDVYWFLTQPGARVVAVCQSQADRAALNDLSYKFRLFFDSLERLGVKLEFGQRSSTEWTLPKRDATLRLIQAGAGLASAGKKGRGGTVNRLHLSDAAYYDNGEATFNSINESVAREGSEIVIESTANGASGWYYLQWRAAVEGSSAFKPHFFPWHHHPEYRIALRPEELLQPSGDVEVALVRAGVAPECIKWRRWKIASKGGDVRAVDADFPSDPDTCFLLEGRGFFDAELVSRQMVSARKPLLVEERGMLRIWEPPTKNGEYVIAADAAEGGGGDWSAAVVLERGTGRHVATLRGQLIPWDLAHLLAELGKRYNWAMIAPERNNHGHAVLQALQRDVRYPRLYAHRDGKLGWLTNEASRAPMLDALDAAHRKGVFRTDDADLLREMRTFVVTESGKAEAAKGDHDDLVIAAAIGWACCTARAAYRDFSGLSY